MKLILKFVIKEFLQFKRDKKMLMTTLVAPIIQLIFLGYAATFDVKEIHTVILDNDRTETSRNLVNDFQSTGYFDIDYYVTSYNELTELITNGHAMFGIVIPSDFEKNIGGKKTAKVQAIFDGSDGNKAAIASGYVNGIFSKFSQNILTENFQLSGMKVPLSGSIQPEVRIWYNPDLTTRNYMLPSIAGLIIMLVTSMLTSLAIVKEREIGTLEQLIVTPLKPYQMILGKFIPFSILGFISESLVLAMIRYWFQIPIKGSVVLLFVCAFIFMFSTLGLGLFISTISKTQAQAMITSAFGIIMPMVFLSGFAFPIENMPVVVQYVTYLIPLRYFNTIIRGIILKGVGLESLWPDVLMLFLFGIMILTLSSLRFSKKLE
ncbi:MAG: ABC transporter permease [Ignavibacteriae bacterium]|nr:MAG: ABC transporter permease [Ignavibacteriota bacterium]